MSRPLRITFPGAIYPMTSRGNAQAAIYAADADRRAFVDLLTQIVQRYHWLCHAYCLGESVPGGQAAPWSLDAAGQPMPGSGGTCVARAVQSHSGRKGPLPVRVMPLRGT
jgi:hypothetical protein